MTNTNPWLISPGHSEQNRPSPAPQKRPDNRGATSPQPGIPAPDQAHQLPRRTTAAQATLWWVGAHGGAGETTLAALAPDTLAADHGWPIPATPDTTHRVVLVGRSNYTGLVAVQRAATEWAANTLANGVQLAGIVLIADAPGRQPKALKDLEQVIAGGVPRAWHLPWVDAWRHRPATATEHLPKEFRSLFTDLSLTPPSALRPN